MAGIFKKAMGLFVEFEEDQAKGKPMSTPSAPVARPAPASQAMNADEVDKFGQHFERIFDQANFTGPDYYEFWKMCETLATHIPDEKSRFAATYASLAIQGLTKERLVETAAKYKELISLDKVQFEKLTHDKSERDIGSKQNELQQLNEKILNHSERIKTLTAEINEAQAMIGNLNAVVREEESKLARNKQGYAIASEAMIRKIENDITKIQSTL